MGGLSDGIQRHIFLIPEVELALPTLIDGYCGQGYVFPTPDGIRAMQIFQDKEKIKLEPVYTAKTCAALLDRLHQDPYVQKTLLYWHIYYAAGRLNKTTAVNYQDLPRALHRFFQY